MPASRTAHELFDPAFLRSLEGLRIQARRVPAGGRHAEQRSKALGAGVEFADVRPYVPGDDFRAVDWNLFQRLDRLYLRLFLTDQDLPVYFLLDQSRSMAMSPAGREVPADKTTTARRAVAALSYVVLQQLDRVAVFPFAGGPLRPLPGASGQAAFHRLLAFLAELPATGGTGLVDTLHGFAHRRLRRGLCVVVSDFLDPAGAEAITPALRALRHPLLLLRVVHPGEDRPALRGAIEVEDCESGERLPLHVDEALLDRYQREWSTFGGRLRKSAERRGGGYLELSTGEPTVPQLARLFPRGVLRT